MNCINDEFGILADLNKVGLGIHKYVRFEDDTVLFMAVSLECGHKDIAACYPLPPKSAGTIWIKNRDGKRKWFFREGGSLSLGVHQMEDDEEFVGKAIPDVGYEPSLKWEY